jgi:serine protease Do
MGLATDIVRFFYIDFDSDQAVKTLEDFGKSQPGWEECLNIVEVIRVCTHLEQHGYLMEARTSHNHPILGRAYVAPGFDERRAEYGEYDFVGYGFARVRADLGDAVRPVVVTRHDEEEDIGTSFLIGNQNTLITARHVVQAMSRIRIPDRDGSPIRAQSIIVPNDPSLDVAVILAEKPLTGLPFFRVSQHSPLDEVLCLGFPPIPGFQEILITDIATVNAEIKSSYCRVVGTGSAYLDGQRYFLMNARVKGGNSGGPIVDRKGYVVGILVQSSMNATDTSNLDTLGYGVATPVDEWCHLFGNDTDKAHGGIELSFRNLEDGGFSTL